jgi:ankyrin repeat protein
VLGEKRFVLQAGVNVHAADRDSRTALYHAAQRCRPDAIRLLTKAGAKLETYQEVRALGSPADFLARFKVGSRNYELVHRMAEAAEEGDMTSLRCLLEAGLNPDVLELGRGATTAGPGYETNALILAVSKNQLDAVRLLLEYGADPTLLVAGVTVLDHAKLLGRDAAVSLLVPGETIRFRRAGDRVVEVGAENLPDTEVARVDSDGTLGGAKP